MTKIQISNDPNPFCQANCFEFRASIFEFPSYPHPMSREPCAQPVKIWDTISLEKGGGIQNENVDVALLILLSVSSLFRDRTFVKKKPLSHFCVMRH